MPLKTKICGLKKKIEVETAIKYGAAFCGFILNYPSSHRHIKNLDQIEFNKSKDLTFLKENKLDINKFNILYT